MSFDEPLSTDWDGNELLLSDILGTRTRLRHSAGRRQMWSAVAASGTQPPAGARENHHLYAVRPDRWRRTYAKRGGGSARHLAIVYFSTGKAHYETDEKGYDAVGVIEEKRRFSVPLCRESSSCTRRIQVVCTRKTQKARGKRQMIVPDSMNLIDNKEHFDIIKSV